MSSDVVGKKLSELRVYDLKTELEKRGLETTGIKIALLERLQKVGRTNRSQVASQANDSILFFFLFLLFRFLIRTRWKVLELVLEHFCVRCVDFFLFRQSVNLMANMFAIRLSYDSMQNAKNADFYWLDDVQINS